MTRRPVGVDEACRCPTRAHACAGRNRPPARTRSCPPSRASARWPQGLYLGHEVCVCVRARATVPGCILDTRALAATTLGSATAMPCHTHTHERARTHMHAVRAHTARAHMHAARAHMHAARAHKHAHARARAHTHTLFSQGTGRGAAVGLPVAAAAFAARRTLSMPAPAHTRRSDATGCLAQQ